MSLQEAAALAQGLAVGVDLPNILHFGTVLAQQTVVDAELDTADDGEIVPLHEIVDLVDGAVGAVLDGQDTELALAPLHRLVRLNEILAGNELGIREDRACRLCGKSTGYAAVGDVLTKQ